MADAQVRVVDAVGTARSDAAGHYSLAGLPAGTQVLEARHVGFLVGQQPVELRAGRAAQADLRLARIVTLDSVRIVAQRARLHEFERRASVGSAGRFLTETQIAGLHVREAGDIFRNGRTLGFTVVGEGIDAKVRSTRGLASLAMTCNTNVVIDGMQHQDINIVASSSIAAIEVYRGAAGAPPEYDSACGAVISWTKR
ncbi:MAG: hypothetical protein JWN79_1937 [Gemmatimonadetes bacterium]|nr:hypothetical protein [Gemmatimonadota bacterium]